MKIAIVGVGGMGTIHFNVYKGMENVELVACDVRLDMLKEKVGDLPVRCYVDMDELLLREHPDLVDICTPTYLHADQAVKAMEAGAHVLSEKPMGMSSEDCDRIIAAVRKTGKRYMTAHVVRFMRAYEYLAAVVASGKYGKLESLTMRRVSQTPMWSWENWFLDEEKSGHVSLDLMIHDVDFMQYLFGEPRDIVGIYHPMTGNMTNYAMAHYLYDGFTVSVETGWYNDQSFRFAAEYTAVFEKGNLKLRDGVLYEGNAEVDLASAKSVEDTGINLSSVDGYAGEIEYFVECVLNSVANERVTPESSAATVALVERTLSALTRV